MPPDVSESDGLTLGEQVTVRVRNTGNPRVHRQRVSPLKAQKQAPYPPPRNLKARLPRGRRIKHKHG